GDPVGRRAADGPVERPARVLRLYARLPSRVELDPRDRKSVVEGKRGDLGGTGFRRCALPISAIRSVGERLMDRWNGPLAYFGSTRVCHPVWNSILGRQLAIESFAAPGRRLGGTTRTAGRLSHAKPDPKATDLESTNRRAIEGIAASMLRNTKVDIDRLKD